MRNPPYSIWSWLVIVCFLLPLNVEFMQIIYVRKFLAIRLSMLSYIVNFFTPIAHMGLVKPRDVYFYHWRFYSISLFTLLPLLIWRYTRYFDQILDKISLLQNFTADFVFFFNDTRLPAFMQINALYINTCNPRVLIRFLQESYSWIRFLMIMCHRCTKSWNHNLSNSSSIPMRVVGSRSPLF